MSDVVIEVKNLKKMYHIGHKRKHTSLRESIGNALNAPIDFLRKPSPDDAAKVLMEKEASEIWPLNGVSFSIRSGEIVGLIGRNGAGKTTLLQILSQITTPTSGEAKIWGRVGALLGAGTGFHMELTGNENIFLRGAILGMTRTEVLSKYDAIIEFSGVEEFLYTPVKHYSKGMLARLAFSVDVHLEPEVLLLDEVLSVGDAEFRPKSLEKMTELIGSGCTVIFVNHSIAAINKVCTRAIWLDQGNIAADGTPYEVAEKYEKVMESGIEEETKKLAKKLQLENEQE